MSLVEI
ncbi:Protein of unknown function [Bacillus mycoides]|nr:Protein of unknown function [Bacillus mycoides]